MMKSLLALGLISVASTTMAQDAAERIAALTQMPTGTVIYENAAIIDGTGAGLKGGLSIVVTGERIAAVATPAEIEDLELNDYETVDAEGWYVLPGLIDTHVHLATLPNREWSEAILYRQLYAGVTSVRDMAGDARALADIARRASIRAIDAPDVHFSALVAGPGFFEDPRTVVASLGKTPGSVPWLQAVEASTDLTQAIAMARGTSATGLKIYADLPGPMVRNVIEESRLQGFPVWTHLQVFPAAPLDAIEAGATSVSHVCMVPRFILKPNTATYAASKASIEDAPEFAAADNRVVALFNAMRDNNVVLDATISMLDDDEPTDPPRLCTAPVARQLVGVAHATGVRISAGTDWASPSNDEYPALIRELEALSRAGLSTMDVIVAGTANGAAAMGLEDAVGTIEPGKFANLVFVSENPLRDIGNLRSVVLTVKRGTQYPRSNYTHRGIPEIGF